MLCSPRSGTNKALAMQSARSSASDSAASTAARAAAAAADFGARSAGSWYLALPGQDKHKQDKNEQAVNDSYQKGVAALCAPQLPGCTLSAGSWGCNRGMHVELLRALLLLLACCHLHARHSLAKHPKVNAVAHPAGANSSISSRHDHFSAAAPRHTCKVQITQAGCRMLRARRACS